MIAKTYYVKVRFESLGMQHEYIAEYVYRKWAPRDDSVNLRKLWFKGDGDEYNRRAKKVVHITPVYPDDRNGHDLHLSTRLSERLVWELGRALPFNPPPDRDFSQYPF